MKKNIVTGFIIIIVLGVVVIYSRTREVSQTAHSTMSFFVTSTNPGKGGDLGGLSGADAYCKSLATSVGQGDKEWRAYLSTKGNGGVGGIHARDRIGNGPWYNAQGELVASSLEELHGNNNISKATALNERGEIVLGRGDTPNMHDILTGSTVEGRFVATTTDTTCGDWTSSDSGSAYVGHHDRIGRDDSAPMKSWNSSHLTRGCSMEAFKTTGGSGLFYCFAK